MKTLASRVSLVLCLLTAGLLSAIKHGRPADVLSASTLGGDIGRAGENAFRLALTARTFARRVTAHICILCALSVLAFSQSREHGSRGEHLIAVVPMIGTGTPSDPRRPMFVPNPNDVSAAMASGQPPSFLAIHFVMTDDGKNAIVEFVGKDRSALKQIYGRR